MPFLEIGYFGRALQRAARACADLALIFVLSAAPTLSALGADARPLSFDDAVRLAEAQAPSIAARRAAAESAADTVAPAGALPDPQLVAGIDNLPVTTSDAFSVTRDPMTTRKIGVMQEFPRREKRRLRTQRAQAEAAREQAMLISEQLSVRESVARAWIMRATAERRVQLLLELEPRAQVQVAAAAAALRTQRGSAADAIAAKTAQALLADRISQAEREVEDSRAEFARWLPDDAQRALGDAPDWSHLDADPDSLAAGAARHREMLAYEGAEQVASADVALARAEKRPDWSVEFDYAQRGPTYSKMVSVEFRIGLPLFAARRQDPLIASKQATLAKLEAEREDARRMHAAQLRKTVAAWRSAVDRTQRYERELLPLANDRADAALAAYRGGKGDLQAALTAYDRVIDERIAYAELQGALGQAWAALHFAFPQER